MEPVTNAFEGLSANFNIAIHTSTPVVNVKEGESCMSGDLNAQGPRANAMDLKTMLNASDDETNSSSEIEADEFSDSEDKVGSSGSAAPRYLNSIQRVRSEPAPAYPYMSWNPENTLPPLQIESFPPRSVLSSQDRQLDKLTNPQVFHRRKSSPGGAQKHHTHGEYRFSKIDGRRLPNRSIQPQTRRSMSAGSQRKHWEGQLSHESHHTHFYDEQTFVQGDDEKRSAKKSHSNKPYTQEQVHWIRYMKEDCGLRWGDLVVKYKLDFPDAEPRTSNQCFSARHYRNNLMPKVDDELNLILGPNGKAIYVAATVRRRSTPEGKAVGFPSTFLELYPELAIKYPWVSNEHRERAKRILCSSNPNDVKEKHRRNLRFIEANGL